VVINTFTVKVSLSGMDPSPLSIPPIWQGTVFPAAPTAGQTVSQAGSSSSGPGQIFSLVSGAGHLATRVAHEVTSFASSVGNTVSSNVAAATGLGAAGVVTGGVWPESLMSAAWR